MQAEVVPLPLYRSQKGEEFRTRSRCLEDTLQSYSIRTGNDAYRFCVAQDLRDTGTLSMIRY